MTIQLLRVDSGTCGDFMVGHSGYRVLENLGRKTKGIGVLIPLFNVPHVHPVYPDCSRGTYSLLVPANWCHIRENRLLAKCWGLQESKNGQHKKEASLHLLHVGGLANQRIIAPFLP